MEGGRGVALEFFAVVLLYWGIQWNLRLVTQTSKEMGLRVWWCVRERRGSFLCGLGVLTRRRVSPAGGPAVLLCRGFLSKEGWDFGPFVRRKGLLEGQFVPW